MRVLVAGAGIFALTAALELRRRGHEVRLVDPGPVPHPLAASTDISKVVRLEYGGGIATGGGERIEADQVVLALGAWTPHALPWLAAEFRSTGHPVFHLTPEDTDAFSADRFPVF